MTSPQDGPPLVRVHVLTQGRAYPTRNHLDVVTLVMSVPGRETSGLSPEQQRIVELCLPGHLSLAEVAGHLSLASSIVKIVIADLIDSGHITTRNPIPRAERDLPRRELMEEVLRGLRAM